jgi:hypothetical protein
MDSVYLQMTHLVGTYTVNVSPQFSLLLLQSDFSHSGPAASLVRNEVDGRPSPDCPKLILNDDNSEAGVLVVAVGVEEEGTGRITLTP